jgi:putative transposase
VPLKIAYLLMRWLFALVALVFHGDQAKDAELLVLRHENAVLRRNAGRIRYEPSDRAWFAALAPFIPRRRWAGIFPVTPATLLAWHRRLAAEVRHQHAPPDRPPADRAEHRPDRRPPGEGEPAVGLPADPWRADQTWSHRRAVDRL